MEYFGTDLSTAGHYFWNLEGDYLERSKTYFKDIPFSPEELPYQEEKNSPRRKGAVYFYYIGGYSILAIEGSCSDDRWGTKSVFFINRRFTISGMIDLVKEIPIAMKIINQMKFDVDFFKPEKIKAMKKIITKSEIVVQGPDQDAASFREDINKMMQEVCLRDNVDDGVKISSSASSTGRMTVILYWNEKNEFSPQPPSKI